MVPSPLPPPPLTPLSLDFFCPGVHDTPLLPRSPWTQAGAPGRPSLQWGLGSGFVVISWFSVWVQQRLWGDKQRSFYTFYIMTDTYCKTLLLPKCLGCRAAGEELTARQLPGGSYFIYTSEVFFFSLFSFFTLFSQTRVRRPHACVCAVRCTTKASPGFSSRSILI